jgi:predicted pyridoxine 5'-phosphate oxidase superfamily flavin-nucleotide-binding protein
LCWLATADADGAPNVSPKEVFCAFGRDSILIANIASPGSVRNILVNPRVCLSFVDVFVQKGYKLRGLAAIVAPETTRYRDLLAPLAEITQGAFPIRSIVAMQVTDVEPIMAPSYRLISGTTEESQIASALKTYGVLAKPPDA